MTNDGASFPINYLQVILWGEYCYFWRELWFWRWSDGNWKFADSQVLLWTFFDRDWYSSPFFDRYWFYPWYFSNLWSTLSWPRHVADLLGFLYIEGKRGRICWNSFFSSGFPDVLLKSISFLISLLCCASQYACLLSTFR